MFDFDEFKTRQLELCLQYRTTRPVIKITSPKNETWSQVSIRCKGLLSSVNKILFEKAQKNLCLELGMKYIFVEIKNNEIEIKARVQTGISLNSVPTECKAVLWDILQEAMVYNRDKNNNAFITLLNFAGLLKTANLSEKWKANNGPDSGVIKLFLEDNPDIEVHRNQETGRTEYRLKEEI